MKPMLLVFARAPIPGACKSRLQPALGAAGAAALYARLLASTLARAETLAHWDLRLMAADAGSLAFFEARLTGSRWQLALQEDADLGVRMLGALNAVTIDHRPCVLIGSDILDWVPNDLVAAAAALRTSTPVALAPAADGGFWLLGAREPLPTDLFAGVTWGSDVVARRARAALGAHGLSCWMGPQRHDIDRLEDLERHAVALSCLPAAPEFQDPASEIVSAPASGGVSAAGPEVSPGASGMPSSKANNRAATASGSTT